MNNFELIHNPLTNNIYSIFSVEGKNLIKKYIKILQKGGTKKESESYEKKLNDCEQKLAKCKNDNNILKSTGRRLLAEYKKLQTVYTTEIEKKKTVETSNRKSKTMELATSNSEMTIEIISDNKIKINNTEYLLNNQIGVGAMKSVYKITDEVNSINYAILKIYKDNLKGNSKERLYNELNCLRNLNHENIIKFYGHIENNLYHIIVLEYSEGDLKNKIPELLNEHKNNKYEQTKTIIHDMANALLYLKENNISHRDIKPENFLMGMDNKVKLTDFGISTLCPNSEGYNMKIGMPLSIDSKPQKLLGNAGTYLYIGPEYYKMNEEGDLKPVENSIPNDVFALGISILELFYDKNIDYNQTKQLYINTLPIKERLNKNFKFPSEEYSSLEQLLSIINDKIFNKTQGFIEGMLNEIPEERITIEEIVKKLEQ